MCKRTNGEIRLCLAPSAVSRQPSAVSRELFAHAARTAYFIQNHRSSTVGVAHKLFP
ncbi:hypothetical protein [Moorena bouillonii]|uniref:hypothetical protein n=1 Tax=Moorena bouillonii TaxID=207920 RepID=UPI0013010A5B|nr:hypothetical protein [Moorena bouillonii]